MTWSDFYLFCFAAGFVFSLLSFLAGGLHWHLPIGHHGAAVGLHAGHGLATHPAGAGTSAGGGRAAARSSSVSRFNFVTLAAFLAWFGGMGYLLTRYSTLWLVFSLVIAVLTGFAGASVVSLFLTRVLIASDENLDPADFEMPGVLGRVSSPILEDGTGEIIYSQGGTRRGCGARSDDGQPIPKGAEVVVTRYEKGIAYVRRWADLANDDHMARS
jgi:membrane protein implicated in regulation of membrane protease activity